MARADLHHALAVDREIYEASRVDPSVMDPVVRIDGGVPGIARPFVVVRRYQGPQGFYIEQFALTDQRGNELYRSDRRRIGLEGEMFEDRFATVLSGLQVLDGAEHRLTFYVDDDEVGTVPVFIETAEGGDPRTVAEETFKSACKKSTIMWITVPGAGRRNGRRGPAGDHTQPIWYIYDDGKVYVFSGPGEQDVPGLGDAKTVELAARSKDVRSLISRVRCDVAVVGTDDERFEQLGKTALTRRLNLPDGDAAYERWKSTCILVELTPRFREADEPAAGEATAAPAAAAPSAQEAPAGKAERETGGGAAAVGGGDQTEQIHVEAEIDQEVFDKLVAEGKPERVARAQAKAAYVRREKARIRAERADA